MKFIEAKTPGFAKSIGRDWRDEYSTSMLAISAKLAARERAEYQIPVVWLSSSISGPSRRGIRVITTRARRSGARPTGTRHRVPYSGLSTAGSEDPRRERDDARFPGPQERPSDASPAGTTAGGSSASSDGSVHHGYDVGEVDGDFGPNTERAGARISGR